MKHLPDIYIRFSFAPHRVFFPRRRNFVQGNIKIMVFLFLTPFIITLFFSIFTWFFPSNQHIFLDILETSESLANGYIFMCQEVCNVPWAASIWWIMAQTGAGTWKAGKFLDSKITADVFRPVWISFRQNKGLTQYWLLHEKQITK